MSNHNLPIDPNMETLNIAKANLPNVNKAIFSSSTPKSAATVHESTAYKSEVAFQIQQNICVFLWLEEQIIRMLLQVVNYSAANFTADKGDRKSITDAFTTIDDMQLSWGRKKQVVFRSLPWKLSLSYSIMVQKLLGIRELLQQLNVSLDEPMPLRVNNQAAFKQLQGKRASTKAKYIYVRIKLSVILLSVELQNMNI